MRFLRDNKGIEFDRGSLDHCRRCAGQLRGLPAAG